MSSLQFYIGAADTYHQSFVVWAPQVVALSVAFAWLYGRSGGSLLLVMLMHSAINNSKDIVASAATMPPGVFSPNAPSGSTVLTDRVAGRVAVSSTSGKRSSWSENRQAGQLEKLS